MEKTDYLPCGCRVVEYDGGSRFTIKLCGKAKHRISYYGDARGFTNRINVRPITPFKLHRISFKKCYRGLLEIGEKMTTCRIGDRSKRYKIGEYLRMTVGDRYHPETVAIGLITGVEKKPWLAVTFRDLIHESPDCRTKGGLYCTMYHINKTLLKDDDVVTLLNWRLLMKNEWAELQEKHPVIFGEK